jgi:hypothetical protein
MSGRYVINNFRADNGGVINIDLSAPAADGSGLGNEIIICVQQRLELFRDTNISLTGTAAGSAANVYWEAHGAGESGMGSGTFIGTLYAPNGTIRFTNNNTSITGALYAGESVFFGNSTTLDFVPVTVTGVPLFP